MDNLEAMYNQCYKACLHLGIPYLFKMFKNAQEKNQANMVIDPNYGNCRFMAMIFG